MVFGGDVLLGTCVGFQGSVGGSGGRRGPSGGLLAALGGSAGGEVSRAVARPEPRAPIGLTFFCGGQRSARGPASWPAGACGGLLSS